MSAGLADLYYYGAGAGGGPEPPEPTERTFAMTGAGQLAQVGGPLVSRPGEVTPEMRALLFHRPAINAPVAELTYALGHTFQDRLQDLGTGSVELLNTDTVLDEVWDHECVVRFEIKGRAAFAMIVNDLEHTEIAEGEEHDERTKLSGLAHISCLQESVVYPPNGPDAHPVADVRIFSWPSVDLNDANWITADALCTQSNPPAFPAGVTPAPLHDSSGASGSYWTDAVSDWPDTGAWWMWAHWPNNREWAPAGTCYFRGAFEVTDPNMTQLLCYAVLDDEGEVWIDGTGPIITAEYGPEPVGIYPATIDITPGHHIIAIKCTNMEDPEGDQIHNPGGVLFTAYGLDDRGQFVGTGPVVHSDSNWSIVEYPPQPPGFTCGEVIRHCIREGQARGCFPEVTLNFTDQFDSAGTPWPITGDISTNVSTDLWTFIGDELATTYCDIWMGPGDFGLYAWVHDGRGHDRPVEVHGVIDEHDPQSGNLRGLTHHQAR